MGCVVPILKRGKEKERPRQAIKNILQLARRRKKCHLDAETRKVEDEEAPGGEARAAVAAQEDKIARLKATGASAHSIKAAEDHHRTLMETVVREVGALSWYLTGDGGLRGRVRNFIDELKEIERARWREELQRRWDSGEEKKIQQGCAKCIDGCICCCSFVEHSVEDEAADPADAIRRAEAARLKLIEHAGGAAPRSSSSTRWSWPSAPRTAPWARRTTPSRC